MSNKNRRPKLESADIKSLRPKEKKSKGKYLNDDTTSAFFSGNTVKQDNVKGRGAHSRVADQQSKRRRLGKVKIAAIFVGAIALALVATLGVWILYINHNLHSFESGELQALNESLIKPADSSAPYYVLVVGSDTREQGTDGRSDSILLCRVDPTKKQVSMLSIPRDLRVDLEGHGMNKINAAMAYGGPDEAVRAISNFVGVPIAHYVQIDFTGFKDIVNALGGVTVNVPAYTYYNGVSLQAGKQKLNGDQALVFVRCRKTYAAGDFQRAANQRQLARVVAHDVLGSSPTSMPGLITTISQCVRTDMDTTGIIALAQSMRGMNTSTDIYSGQVPCTTAMIDGGSYDLPINAQWASVKKKFVEGTVPFVAESEKQEGVIE
ncbi:MAG: LCP family protein [Actinomycetia bacterium]|nr:LCP family protein [Actinomycetes bacterium]